MATLPIIHQLSDITAKLFVIENKAELLTINSVESMKALLKKRFNNQIFQTSQLKDVIENIDSEIEDETKETDSSKLDKIKTSNKAMLVRQFTFYANLRQRISEYILENSDIKVSDSESVKIDYKNLYETYCSGLPFTYEIFVKSFDKDAKVSEPKAHDYILSQKPKPQVNSAKDLKKSIIMTEDDCKNRSIEDKTEYFERLKKAVESKGLANFINPMLTESTKANNTAIVTTQTYVWSVNFQQGFIDSHIEFKNTYLSA